MNSQHFPSSIEALVAEPLRDLPQIDDGEYEYYFEVFARIDDLQAERERRGNASYQYESDRESALKMVDHGIALLESASQNSHAPAGWMLRPRGRVSAYNAELRATLAVLHRAGAPRPTAMGIIGIWRLNPPQGIEVLERSIRYQTDAGESKEADLDAIRNAINYHIEKVPS